MFRFEEVCLKEPRREKLVIQLWNESSLMFNQRTKSIHSLQHTFKDLRIRKVAKELKRIENLLKEDTSWYADYEEIKKFKALEKQRDKLQRIEETMCKERSREVWLKDGDLNTMFFT